ALFHAELVVEYLDHGGKAVRGAGSVGNDVVIRRIVAAGVDPDTEGDVGVLGGRRDDHLLGPGFEVLAGPLAIDEETGGLEHDGYALARPVEFGGVPLRRGENAVTVHGDGFVVVFDRAIKSSRGGIVL